MLALLPLLLPLIASIISKIIPDSGQAAQINLELQKALLERQDEIDKAVAEAAKAQADINLAEAQSPSIFKSGWRPMVGWTCAVACGYSFLLQPLLSWLCAALGVTEPPVLDSNILMTLLGGMLGIGTLRTVDKIKGVA